MPCSTSSLDVLGIWSMPPMAMSWSSVRMNTMFGLFALRRVAIERRCSHNGDMINYRHSFQSFQLIFHVLDRSGRSGRSRKICLSGVSSLIRQTSYLKLQKSAFCFTFLLIKYFAQRPVSCRTRSRCHFITLPFDNRTNYRALTNSRFFCMKPKRCVLHIWNGASDAVQTRTLFLSSGLRAWCQIL